MVMVEGGVKMCVYVCVYVPQRCSLETHTRIAAHVSLRHQRREGHGREGAE